MAEDSSMEQRAALLVAMEGRDGDPEYVLGRLLAVTEWLERSVNGEAAASKYVTHWIQRIDVMPRRCYVEWGRTANLRLSGLHNPKWRRVLDDLVVQLGSSIDPEALPERLTERQAGWATSGYYHQRAALFNVALRATEAEHKEAIAAAKAGALQLVAQGMPEAEAARRVGINRMTLRKARAEGRTAE